MIRQRQAPVVNTDLTGKAGTRTPIDVIAEPGAKIELFDKDGNKIGELLLMKWVTQ